MKVLERIIDGKKNVFGGTRRETKVYSIFLFFACLLLCSTTTLGVTAGEDGYIEGLPEGIIDKSGPEPVAMPGTIVLDFEDLPPADIGRLPSGYSGLEWDCYYEGDFQWWDWKSESVDPGYSEPHSGDNYLFNAYGGNELGFSLPNPGDYLLGAWFAKTTAVSTPDSVRFNGYDASHNLIQQSQWLTLSYTPQYLAANFNPLARIEVEHSNFSSAWYAMDDLTYVPEPATVSLFAIGGLALLRKRRQ